MNTIDLTDFGSGTICAVSTPQGRGGIAVIRVSGPQALDIVGRCWQGKSLADMPSHTVHLGHLIDATGDVLDQVVLTIYRAPNSFTGEDVVELACHGSTWIQQQVIQTLIDAGCRHATAGEFTRRAFANGRMDLSQAEAVADVIEAQSRAAHHVAMSQMRGRYSEELKGLRDKLLHFVSLIELELDFSEEDVNFADRSEVTDLAREIHALISRLADSYRDGNAIRNGMPVAIVGQTNAGKSTLLNALTGSQVYVQDQLFATLDAVSRRMVTPENTEYLLTDTVGFIRKLPHTLVSAFRSTLEEAALADVLVIVSDGSSKEMFSQHDTVEEVLAELGATEQKRIEVINKCDEGDPDPVFPGAVMISAKTGEGLEDLKAKIAETLQASHRPVTFVIPFSRYGILSEIRPLGRVITENHTDTGTELTLMIAEEDAERMIRKYGAEIVKDS